MDLTTLRDELRFHLGIDATDLDDAGCDRFLNASFAELDNKFPFRQQESRLDFVTTSGEHKYQFNAALEAVVTVSIEDEDSLQKSVLIRMTLTDYEGSVNNDADYQGAPTHYVRNNDCIILYPTPDDQYDVTVRYLKVFTELVNSGDIPDLPYVWHEILLYGAIWRGFMRIGDMNRADRIKSHQVSLITSTVPQEGKEEFDTHTGGVLVRGRRSYR